LSKLYFGITRQIRVLFPIYFHGLPGAIRKARPDLHFQLANAVAEFTLRDQRLTPFCSTFVLHVTK